VRFLCKVDYLVLAAILALTISSGAIAFESSAGREDFDWPAIGRQCRPWTYWWWMGSAVEKSEITSHLEAYSKAGIGGVHIIPIYGAKGYEKRYIPYLTPEWIEMLRYTVAEAARLEMGVDMTCGTGWPFGGGWVDKDNAAAMVLFETYSLSGGRCLYEKVRSRDELHGKDALLEALMAFSEAGDILDLYELVDSSGKLDWTAPDGKWKLYAVFRGWTGQEVKRAAPGGEGNVIDYFSQASLNRYLSRFDKAFAGFPRNIMPRAFYHDSYEVYRADWTSGLFREFQTRRGYDLRRQLPALLGDEPDREIVARVRCDYRETVSDLLLEEFTVPWVAWCHVKGSIARNQAHGSPGNLLDLYAAADIPETEAFGPSGFPIPGLRVEQNFPQQFGKPDILVSKFASSAAHIRGRPLTSSESCTWLGENFRVALSQAKPEIDKLFISGINHVFYHGMTYSPAKAEWPGWLFYASTNFGLSNTIWNDLPELNAYIARCQAFLQSGQPDNDILLYFPIHDLWQKGEGGVEFEGDDQNMLLYFGVHNPETWLYGSSFWSSARTVQEQGYAFDYISDRLLKELTADREGLRAGSSVYRVIVIPECLYMPAETLERLVDLATGGATVIVAGELPADVPGYGDLANRRSLLEKSLEVIKPLQTDQQGIRQAGIGKGRFILGDSLLQMLEYSGVPRERIADQGLEFIRRSQGDGRLYFLTNLGQKKVEGWVSLAVKAGSVSIFDPLHKRYGLAAIRQGQSDGTEVYIQLFPGQSCILRTSASGFSDRRKWQYLTPGGEPWTIQGTWEVSFTGGGPSLPETLKTGRLVSWTELDGTETKDFAGTARYSVSFQKPPAGTREWLLDLGRVHESAKIWLNGRYIGALWCHPYRISFADTLLNQGENTLQVEVTNLAANRIVSLDRRKVQWRRFNDINFVNIRYEPFDASGWPGLPSGLLGPVRLVPGKSVFEEH